jgi:two-component system, sensor histidine kinase and response regulator
MMGGKIWLESQVGVGSHFHFTVRFKTSDQQMPATGDANLLHGVKVLVVDDNLTNRRILEGMLKHWNLKATCVAGGQQALAELSAALQSAQPYRLVLTDMHMPGMDGFALVEQIRQRPELSAATIMMLTSAAHKGDARRCKELNVAVYLSKPVRQAELHNAILRSLGARDQAGLIPAVANLALGDSGVSKTPLRILLAEDNLVNQRLAVRMLEKRGHSIAIAANGREALEALEKDSFDLVLMDVQMPEMDGLEAVAGIRRKEMTTGGHQMVVALTAHAMKGDQERCLSAGMDGYLTKPIRPQELDEILNRYGGLSTSPAFSREESRG